jgi:hypothetical protein
MRALIEADAVRYSGVWSGGANTSGWPPGKSTHASSSLPVAAITKRAVFYMSDREPEQQSFNNQLSVTALCVISQIMRGASCCAIMRKTKAHNGNTDCLGISRYRPVMPVSIPELIAVNACSR